MEKLIVMLYQLVPYCAALLIFITATWLALRALRANLAKTELYTMDYLENFKKLHEEGKITDDEFRNIRRLVSLQIIQKSKEPK